MRPKKFVTGSMCRVQSIPSASSPSLRTLYGSSVQPIKKFAMASSKKWASIISSIASCVYFLVIILQVPLFRVPCTAGICRTPIEATSSQLIACELFPLVVVKALLYPGAFANALIKNRSIPSYGSLKLYKFTNVKAADAISELQRLEVLAGSYLSVAGALLGLIKPGRMSLCGMLLIVWGLVREIILRKSTSTTHVYIYPAMSIALFSAFLSITKDVRRIIRSCRRPRNVKAKLF